MTPTSLPPWLRVGEGGIRLSLHIQPGAKRSEVVGEHGDALKLRLAAPPIDGRANDALLAFLADRLGVSRSSVQLVAGASSRAKRVAISGIDATGIVSRLLPTA